MDEIVAAPRMAWSPAWLVESADAGEVVLGAGADRRIAIDGLGAASVRAIQIWATGAPIEPSTPEQHRVLDRLVAIGAVALRSSSVVLVSAADSIALRDRFAAELERHGIVAVDDHCGDALVVMLRTDAAPVVEPRPHLVVDLRLHHTVVLGPYVVPAITACAGCLDRRTARRWPDVPQPPTPAVHGLLAVVAALTAVQVRLIVAGTSPLANATATWDLEQATCNREPLWKTPGCPVCDQTPGVGRVTLPAMLGAVA